MRQHLLEEYSIFSYRWGKTRKNLLVSLLPAVRILSYILGGFKVEDFIHYNVNPIFILDFLTQVPENWKTPIIFFNRPTESVHK